MQTTAPGKETLFETTPLTLKIAQASRNIPRHWQWRIYMISLGINDFVMIGLAFRLAYFIRFDLGLSVFAEEAFDSIEFYRLLVFILIPIWLVVYALTGLYNRQNLLGGTREYALIFNATTIGMFLVIAVGFLSTEFLFARGWLLIAWASNLLSGIRRAIYPAPGNLLFARTWVLPLACGHRRCKRGGATSGGAAAKVEDIRFPRNRLRR